MSDRAQKCRQMASEAERNARSEMNPAVRLTLLDIAQRWRKMAEQVEVQEPASTEPITAS
jgi:hypothetical protein